MKALTVREPWGYAITRGKDIENRTWPTKYRGPLAIHTSAKIDRAYVAEQTAGPYFDPGILEDLRRAGDPMQLIGGAFIAVVNLVDVHHSSDCLRLVAGGRREFCSLWAMPGQWHWRLSDPVTLTHAVPARGRLQLWDPEPAALPHLADCRMGWQVKVNDREPGTRHVIPVGDTILHPLDDACVCGPSLEHGTGAAGDWWLWTHHSVDGRELHETEQTRGCRHA